MPGFSQNAIISPCSSFQSVTGLFLFPVKLG